MAIHTVKNTEVEMTQLVMPQYTNTIGTVFGGQIVSWIDVCAAVSAQRFARTPVVTASIDSVNFIEPVKQGQVVILRSQVNAVFKTSIEVGVIVIAENPLTGERRKACQAYCTFVALDSAGHPVQLPKLVLDAPEEIRRSQEAHDRRTQRLSHRTQENSICLKR
ncbi:MAG: acyl-CoA thioesterase [Myxococcaceae bacterium]